MQLACAIEVLKGLGLISGSVLQFKSGLGLGLGSGLGSGLGLQSGLVLVGLGHGQLRLILG